MRKNSYYSEQKVKGKRNGAKNGVLRAEESPRDTKGFSLLETVISMLSFASSPKVAMC